jgi:ubiquitin C-terminal hydrolase
MSEEELESKTKKIRILTNYNKKLLPPPVGRNNPGVYCFFNALMSALHSCPVFIKRMAEAAQNSESHSFCRSFTQEYNQVKDFAPREIIKSSNLVDHLMNGLKNSEATKDTDYYRRIQQSDPIEGLELMLAMLEGKNPEIRNIFQYRYARSIKCMKCGQVCLYNKYRERIHRMFKIHPVDDPNASNDDIFISNLEMYIDKIEDMSCPICNGWIKKAGEIDNVTRDTKNAIKTTGITKDKLSVIPEVIGIQINHRWDIITNKNVKKNQYFPMELKFKKVGEDAFLHYKLIAQIEQSGTSRGGHYWTRCLRSDGVYLIDDSTVRKSKFEHTSETCFVMYHHYIPDLIA